MAMPHSLQDLSSLTRDQTHAPAVEARSPNYWTTREFPESLLKRKRKCICITFSKKNLEEKITYKIIILIVKSLLIP